jgi:hypothetical protein
MQIEVPRSFSRRPQSALSTPQVRAALLGEFTSGEFVEVRQRIEADGDVLAYATAASLLEGIGGNPAIEVVFIAQVRPGEWDGGWIDRLRGLAPLVRVVAVLGTWCEGETRTGRPLAADVRVFWHAFPAWWARQTEALRAGRAPDWSFPDCDSGSGTASPRTRDAQVTTRGLAIVAARDRESAESLALALRAGGWSSVWVRPPLPLPDVYGASAIVYDGGQLDADEVAAMADLRQRYGELPIVALADFPTFDRVAAADAVGPTIVLGKPLLLEDLLWAVRNVVHAAEPPVAARCQRAG